MAEGKDQATEGVGTNVTQQELRTAFDDPAVYSNKMLATNVSAGVRIAFMEQLGELVPAQVRAAVLLSFPDAIALRDLLNRQLEAFEAATKTVVKIGPDGNPVAG
jgi:hypothetical protein